MADQPGANGVFDTLGPLFDPGYKVVFRPDISNKQPASPPAFSDPRGILPSGLAPASQLSYEIFETPSEKVIVSNSNVSAGGAVFIQAAGEVTVSSQTITSVIVFEGKDVIDLPTAGLDTSQGGITVPDSNVFLPIFAGDKFIQNPTDDFGTKTSLEYIFPSSGNQVAGMVPSVNPPLDSFSSKNCVIPNFAVRPVIDIASNTIKTKGAAAFVSYVAATKILFRDVVFLNSSAIADGTFDGAGNFTVTLVAPFETGIVNVLRYAFINVNPPDQPAYFQWRLAESFGVDPTSKSDTPNGVVKTPAAATAAAAEAAGKHFVYDLSDSKPDIIEHHFPPRPAKNGISPAFANAKLDPASPFFDQNFKAQIIPAAKNSFFFQSRLTVKRVFGLSVTTGTAPNTVESDRVYQSPTYLINAGQNTRLGLEYSIHRFNFSSVYVQQPIVLLAATTPAAAGIAAYYDPCIKQVLVYLVSEGTVAQRFFNDKTWAISDQPIPVGKLESFLIGESPQVSEGPTPIFPIPSKLVSVKGAKGDIAIPAGSLPTGAVLTVGTPPAKGKPPTILELFTDAGSSGTPAYEQVVAAPAGSLLFVSIPSVSYKSFNIANGGAEVSSFYGSKTATFLPDMALVTPAKPDSFSQLSNLQFSANKSEAFPLPVQSIAGTTLSLYGSAYIAFTTTGRIDMAYRASIKSAFVVIRDVCFRVPDDLTPDTLSATSSRVTPAATHGTAPTVDNPFLMSIRQTSSVLMFYVYKNRLVVKNMSHWIFANVASDVAPIPADKEAIAAASLDKCIPVVVYDGGISDPKKDAAGDAAFGTLVFPKPPTTTSTSTPAQSAQILAHSACRTDDGHIYCFVQDSQRIRTRLSSDNGATWTTIFSDTTTFLPPLKSASTTTGAALTDGDAPFCYYDAGTQTIMFFMTVDNCLLYMPIPEKVLLLPKADADAALAKIVPQLIYGKITDNLTNRGITQQKSVLNRVNAAKTANATFSETFSPQRIAVARLEGGHLRLFFNDTKTILRSLVSSDNGALWQTEDQYVASR